MMICPRCSLEFAGDVCPRCDAPPIEAEPAPTDAQPTNPYAGDPIEAARVIPAVNSAAANPTPGGDGTGGLIPYNNPQALIAYYLGIASGVPLIGLPLGIAAFVLGLRGLKARKQNPAIKGSVHAGIGIGCGGFFAIFWTIICGILVYGFFESTR